MNLSKLSQQELVELIRKASDELAARLARPEFERIASPKAVIVMREPPADEKEYCLMIKMLLRRGEYIRAEERRRVAEIARQYPEWVKRQGLPTESGTGAWRQAKEFHSTPRANER